MTTVIQFVIIGLGVGAAYTLLAQGLVTVFQGSGVVNFAHGALAMIGAFVYYQFHQQNGWSVGVALVASVLLVGLIGAAFYQFVMRPLRTSSPLSRVIATLGLWIILEATALLIWTDTSRVPESILPSGSTSIGDVVISHDKIYLFVIATLATAGLWAASRFTRVGLAVRASGENERAASALGWSPHLLATLTWVLGGGLAALAGIFVSATVGALQVTDMPLLVLPVLAAALAGGFASFWLTYVAAMAIGVASALAAQYIPVAGVGSALPFAIIIVFLVIRGKTLPTRGEVTTPRLPEVGGGRPRWKWIAGGMAVSTLLITAWFGIELIDSLSVTFAWGMILLSVVLLMGLAGQVDLAPMAWGGLGSLVAARLIADLGFPFELALVLGVLAAIPIGLLFALPALRARGLNLAVVTLGLGVMLHSMVFSNPDYTGSFGGIHVGQQSFFGIDIGGIQYPERYAIVAMFGFILCGIVVANVRRGRSGRRLLAVRSNERAAAALGINVIGAKMFAFGLSSAIAALGGIMLVFQFENIVFSETFDPFQSILAAIYAVIGGIGFIFGALWGGQLPHGGYGSWFITRFWENGNNYLFLVSGIVAIAVLLGDQNGFAGLKMRLGKQKLRLGAWIVRTVGGKKKQEQPDAAAAAVKAKAKAKPPAHRPDEKARPLAPLNTKALEIRSLTVRYGGVTAVQNVDLTIRPGEIVGVIGPNGAGKTSLIDAVTGFVRPATGDVLLGDRTIASLPVHQRVRAGVSRSFQSLELFEQSSIRDNLLTAAAPSGIKSYLADIVAPRQQLLPDLALAAVDELKLREHLDQRPSEVSYGVRRLVGIARAIAVSPSVLLLDEPVAGLGRGESDELAATVKRIAREWNLGILLVEHDMTFVMDVCDRILVLDFGRPIAEGTPAEIRTNPDVIAAYLGAHADETEAVAR